MILFDRYHAIQILAQVNTFVVVEMQIFCERLPWSRRIQIVFLINDSVGSLDRPIPCGRRFWNEVMSNASLSQVLVKLSTIFRAIVALNAIDLKREHFLSLGKCSDH